jgi:predicted small lipoprotein YifL
MKKFVCCSLLLVVLLTLTACGGRSPALAQLPVEDGAVADINDMTWTYPDGTSPEVDASRISIVHEVAGYQVLLNDDYHHDVIIEVQTEQLSIGDVNAYGVACRADFPEETETETAPSISELRGYLFLISGDGGYAILRSDGDLAQAVLLAPWRSSIRVEQGMTRNRIRVECVRDELALYVNGESVQRLREPQPIRQGRAGLVVGVVDEPAPFETTADYPTEAPILADTLNNSVAPVEILFENLQIMEVAGTE